MLTTTTATTTTAPWLKLTLLLWWYRNSRRRSALGTQSPWLDMWSVWSCTSRRWPSRTSCSGAAGTEVEEVDNKEKEEIRWQRGEQDRDATCLSPRVLVSHICLMFQKKGCSHFWQESLSSHWGACRGRTMSWSAPTGVTFPAYLCDTIIRTSSLCVSMFQTAMPPSAEHDSSCLVSCR